MYIFFTSAFKYTVLLIDRIILFVSFSSFSISVIELQIRLVNLVCILSFVFQSSCSVLPFIDQYSLLWQLFDEYPISIFANSLSFSQTLSSFTYNVFLEASVQ